MAVSAVFLLAVSMSGQPNQTPKDKGAISDNHHPATVSIDSHDSYGYPQEASTKPKDESLSWDAAIKRPEWWAIVIALGTLGLIWWQARATAKAAEATLKQANHVVASERAWVMVEIKFPPGAGPLSFSGGINDGSTITDFEIIVKNAGRTPAWVYEQVVQMTVSKLPPLPEFDKTSKTDIGVYPVVQDQPATTWKPFIEARGLPDLDGQPYIFGVVRYRDSFSHFRETYFGYVVRDHKRLERLPNPAYNKYT